MTVFPHFTWPTSQALTLWHREGGALAKLAAPLALTQLATMAIVTTDVVMMGWLGPGALAAGSLAGHFYGFFNYVAMGLLGAVAPILAQHLGARQFRMVRRTVRQGFWAAVIVAVPCIAIIWQVEAILMLFGQDPDLASAGGSYLRLMVAGFIPGLWYLVLSEFLAAHVRPRPALLVTVLAIGFNGIADYALMFGHFGFPRLELVGAGIASAVVNVLMFLGLLCFVLMDRRLRRYRLLGRFWRPDWPRFFEIVRLGLPIAVIAMAEFGMFLASALLMGLLGTTPLAAHAIALQCVAVVYMVPLGISQAAAVRVGRAVGSGNPLAAARAGWVAMAVSFALAVLPALLFWFWSDGLVGLFLDGARPGNQATMDLAVSLLAVAALFQFADATQVTALGALRGLKDTRGPMLIAVGGYWGLGLPGAALFGIYLNFGGQAIWIGLAMGLFVVSVLLVWRFRVQSRRATQSA
ncbi:MAG: MATE family efflux transporter [Rhodospirillaceae bacterium]|jgi:multidrug resistance protein, MATE family|nr:MATE family efflux transporter [Rhodospirillaceae bacterium]